MPSTPQTNKQRLLTAARGEPMGVCSTVGGGEFRLTGGDYAELAGKTFDVVMAELRALFEAERAVKRTSSYRGVHHSPNRKSPKKWKMDIESKQFGRRQTWHTTELEAAQAYDVAATEFFGA
jgi:hypothetical protein